MCSGFTEISRSFSGDVVRRQLRVKIFINDAIEACGVRPRSRVLQPVTEGDSVRRCEEWA